LSLSLAVFGLLPDCIKVANSDSRKEMAGTLDELRTAVAASREMTELLVADAFSRAGYKANPHQYYVDPDDGRVRDIALFASKGVLLAASSAPIYLMDLFHAEVRKSEAPWVVLTSERSDNDAERPEPLAGDGLPTRLVAPLNEFARARAAVDLPRVGRSIHVGGAAEAASRDPYEAMLACARASLGIKLAKPRTAWDDSSVLWCVSRLVIFDGELYEGHAESGALELAARDHIPFALHYASAALKAHVVVVHILRRGHLGALLERHRLWLEQLGEQVKSGLA
jgi:hypothetical protein